MRFAGSSGFAARASTTAWLALVAACGDEASSIPAQDLDASTPDGADAAVPGDRDASTVDDAGAARVGTAAPGEACATSADCAEIRVSCAGGRVKACPNSCTPDHVCTSFPVCPC
jgi:hypothetical protein